VPLLSGTGVAEMTMADADDWLRRTRTDDEIAVLIVCKEIEPLRRVTGDIETRCHRPRNAERRSGMDLKRLHDSAERDADDIRDAGSHGEGRVRIRRERDAVRILGRERKGVLAGSDPKVRAALEVRLPHELAIGIAGRDDDRRLHDVVDAVR
jgi:hypothetical protein